MLRLFPWFMLVIFCATLPAYHRATSDAAYSPQSLVDRHFTTWSSPTHVNRKAFEAVFRLMGGRPLNIVETGTSAWGTDSTRLWDAYVQTFGGSVWTVDKRATAGQKLLARGPLSNHTQMYVDDSVAFLKQLDSHTGGNAVDLFYLDSWDVDWNTPEPSAKHGYAEFLQIEARMKPGVILFIDDTPASMEVLNQPGLIGEMVEGRRTLQAAANTFRTNYGEWPGKGALVLKKIRQQPDQYKIFYHEYSVAVLCI